MGKYVGAQLLDPMVNYVKLKKTVFQSGVFSFLPAMNESSRCSAFLPEMDIISFLDFSHTNQHVVLSHCFNLYFPNAKWCRVSFYIPVYQMYICFGKVSRPSAHFKIVLFGVFFFLIFWIPILYLKCDVQIFSPNVLFLSSFF